MPGGGLGAASGGSADSAGPGRAAPAGWRGCRAGLRACTRLSRCVPRRPWRGSMPIPEGVQACLRRGRSTSEAKPSTPEALAWAFRCDSGLSGEWAGLSASCSRGCRRQGPGMPRIGGVYGWGWRGAKFSGSRVPQSCSRAPAAWAAGPGAGRLGFCTGRPGLWGGRAVAGAVASTSGRVARIALAVGAGSSGGSGGPAGGGPRSSPRATHPRGPCDNCARTPPPGVLSVQSQNSAGPAT
jgi:hypothetical protein